MAPMIRFGTVLNFEYVVNRSKVIEITLQRRAWPGPYQLRVVGLNDLEPPEPMNLQWIELDDPAQYR